jgi:putative glycerol-1-phosphate prenyltransferase
MIYSAIQDHSDKKFALLIDPENYEVDSLKKMISTANESGIDFFMVGGSLLSDSIDKTIDLIKIHSDIPVILFPGNLLQVSDKANGILLLSLISGRNPDLLIGNHVLAAKMLKKSTLEIIPTGYILINGGQVSSVEYISNTKPIPANKTEIIVSTAIAGQLLGHKTIYLEAGSGAINSPGANVIKHVKENINIPLIVGGGLKSPEDIEQACIAGANMIVVGNVLEKNPAIINSLVNAVKSVNGL